MGACALDLIGKGGAPLRWVSISSMLIFRVVVRACDGGMASLGSRFDARPCSVARTARDPIGEGEENGETLLGGTVNSSILLL